MAIVLRITNDGSHQFIDISKSTRPIVIGRNDECDITLSGEGLSGAHAEIALRTNYIQLKDLDSKNGTILNGKKINHDKLYVDDIIQVGESYIELHTDSLSTVEKETFKNKRAIVDKKAGDLTIPDISKSQKDKEKLIDEKKARHGFNELTNITGVAVEKVIGLFGKDRSKKKKKSE